MNLDYIEITKFTNKDKLCFDYLQKDAVFNGATRYYFDRCRKIQVWHMEELNQIKIKGSIPYFINGHNFYSSNDDWMEGINYIQGCLNINLFTGLVDCFEYGTIQDIPFDESQFLQHHIKAKGMQSIPYLKGNKITGKTFNSPTLKIKLYDVSRNIKTKLSKDIREHLSSVYGWEKEKHYIKLENHYKKPHIHFKRNVILNELFEPEFQKELQYDLLNSYNMIAKSGNASLPKNKADINAGTIPLLILKELETVYNFNTEDLIKSKLKTIPEEVFSKSDRKARLRTIKGNLNKIVCSNSSYDISGLIEGKISNENNHTPFISNKKDKISYPYER